jgi:hypothetical protein
MSEVASSSKHICTVKDDQLKELLVVMSTDSNAEFSNFEENKLE